MTPPHCVPICDCGHAHEDHHAGERYGLETFHCTECGCPEYSEARAPESGSPSFCDWAPIQPHPTQPCKGGCGTHVDASDGLCRACRRLMEHSRCSEAAYAGEDDLEQARRRA